MTAVQTQRPGAASTVRPEEATGRTPPWTGQRVVNPDKRLAGGRGGQATHRGTAQGESRRSSTEGAQESPREAGCLTQGGGGGGPPPDAPHNGFVRNRGGTAPSNEEGADLQDFTPARAHLLLWEAYGALTTTMGHT